MLYEYDNGPHIHVKEFCNMFWLLANEVEKISKAKAAFFREIANNPNKADVYSVILVNIRKTGVYTWDEHEILQAITPHGVLVLGEYVRITINDTANGIYTIINAYYDDESKIYHEVAKIEDVQYIEQVIRQELKVSTGLLTEINKLDWE